MAKKRCPSCGKRVAPSAPYCLYCSHRFEDRRLIGKEISETEEELAENAQEIPAEDVVQEAELQESSAVENESADVDDSVTDDIQKSDESEQDVVEPITERCSENVFEEVEEIFDTVQQKPRRRMRIVVYGLLVFLVIAAALLYLLAFRDDSETSLQTPPIDDSVPVAGDVGEKQEDFSWVKRYLGIQWVDEASVGKKDVASQGGLRLYIHDVTKENVVFDVFSYAEEGAAFAEGIKAKPLGDGMLFSFENDGFGHSGTGNVHFRDGAIDVDIIVNDNEPLPEGVHSLKMNTVMVPQVLPRTIGKDITSFKHIDDVLKCFEQTQEPKIEQIEENKEITYIFDGMTAVCDESGGIRSIKVSYSENTRTKYCVEHIDGTMSYDVAKLYFGKADEDYKESPTDIHVLTYRFEEEKKIRLVFDAKTMLLSEIQYTI